MEPSHVSHDLVPGSQEQMIRIVEDEMKPQLLELIRLESLHRPQGSYRHEGRSVDLRMTGRQQPDTALAMRIRLVNVIACHLA
jgi:hypothetical protein